MKEILGNLFSYISVEKKEDIAIVTYILDGRLYKLSVKRRRGPPKTLLVIDENDNDVTREIAPFFGPERNWHKLDYTPSFWGKESLTFELVDGESMTFEKDQKIHF